MRPSYPISSPSGREARAWRRGPARQQPKCWNAGRPLVNTDAPDDALSKAERRVLEIQTKLHRWASDDDPHRRFDDLFNLVADPAFLLVAWARVRGNKGARTAGVDGQTAYYIQAVRGLAGFLAELREDLKARTFQPLPVRQRAIPKAGGKVRYLGIAIPNRRNFPPRFGISRSRTGSGVNLRVFRSARRSLSSAPTPRPASMERAVSPSTPADRAPLFTRT